MGLQDTATTSQLQNITMAESVGIQSLPVEMLSEIYSHVIPEDLLALRKTDRKLSFAAFEHFSAAYIVKRKHLMTKFGLEGLLAIAEHPAFSKKVKSIVLVPGGLSESWYRHEYGLEFYDETAAMKPLCVSRKGAKKRQKHRTKLWAKSIQCGDVLEPDDQNRLLSCFLQAFKTAGTRPSIEVTWRINGCDGMFGCWGFRFFRKLLGDCLSLTGRERKLDCSGTVNALLRAIAKTQCPIVGLKLGSTQRLHLPPSGVGWSSGVDRAVFGAQELHTAMRGVNLLHLDLSGFHKRFTEDPNALTDFLASMAQLRDLSITWSEYGDSVRPQFSWVSRSIAVTGIERFKLSFAIFDLEDMVILLKQHQHSLRSVDLSSVDLSTNSWETLLDCMKRDLRLVHLRLHMIGAPEQSPIICNGRLYGMELDNDEGICDGLTSAIEDLRERYR